MRRMTPPTCPVAPTIPIFMTPETTSAGCVATATSCNLGVTYAQCLYYPSSRGGDHRYTVDSRGAVVADRDHRFRRPAGAHLIAPRTLRGSSAMAHRGRVRG